MQSKGYSTRRKESAAVILFLLGSITAWVLYAGELGPPEHRDFSLVAALQAQSPAGATSPAERPHPHRPDSATDPGGLLSGFQRGGRGSSEGRDHISRREPW